MIFGFINKLSITNLNPFSKASRSARLLLTLANKENARSTYGMFLTSNLAPKTSTVNPTVEVLYKDGKKLTIDSSKVNVDRLTDMIDSYSRTLKFKDMIQK
ncbi:ribosomal protein subunit l44 [Schizosaccharomyces cryophilus OY26]|uniref:Large ribosomal subunit protein mL53 n=1 Tax=Schizosaccharomyces cryophilus (strain OY26 / ATCC MYA-4695 / CBS 11777 / NBRC 106824 / NRRL Y48691) TaxID=653667 RepID=S9W6N1_SCHCR|nr:ribosomal protein subunit l44 [Schizosaccharomyces cryophilus OY26]EPY53500.1 ribosomal protein subunit l44 [Schizosaccharomyces cryophilus OY26]